MIEVNIFTNSTSVITSYQTIHDTIDSFKNTFGNFPVSIWIDINPNTNDARHYIKSLFKKYKKIYITSSLSDGYIKAVNQSVSDYVFMLEHDWVFNQENIKHTLSDICKVMSTDNIHHLRFNRFSNITLVDSSTLPQELEKEYYDFQTAVNFVNGPVPYFTVKSASNNPHIINKKLYTKDILNKIKNVSGSFGIEHCLRNQENVKFAVYGHDLLPPAVRHTDGRQVWKY